ncbi:MAG: restriction endonuclease [Nitrospinae bacterium]|nr:restriction endonuclease [Nitrospinota bacterium]
MSTESNNKIFVWRSKTAGWDESINEIIKESTGIDVQADFESCPFCRCKYINSYEYAPFSEGVGRGKHICDDKYECSYCGFWFHYIWQYHGMGGEERAQYVSILKDFDINSSELELDELGTHIKRNFNDVYRLTSRKFEELVGDIFKCSGYEVRLTQESHDGGFDLVLLDKNGAQILVECKRYKASHKVSVETVRNLLGVQLIEGVKKAKLITSSCFTGDAITASNRVSARNKTFEIDLIDASKLLMELDVYNKNLPPLHLLDRYSGI